MPEIRTTLRPTEAIDRIEQFLRDFTVEQLPQTLRDQRVARVALDDRRGDQLTVRFGSPPPSKLVRYCDCRAVPADDGSAIHFVLRGPWNPKLVGGLVFALLLIQIIYQLVTGTFDRIMLVIATVVPGAAAYLAHLDNKTVRKNFHAGALDLLHMALHIVPNSRTEDSNH